MDTVMIAPSRGEEVEVLAKAKRQRSRWSTRGGFCGRRGILGNGPKQSTQLIRLDDTPQPRDRRGASPSFAPDGTCGPPLQSHRASRLMEPGPRSSQASVRSPSAQNRWDGSEQDQEVGS